MSFHDRWGREHHVAAIIQGATRDERVQRAQSRVQAPGQEDAGMSADPGGPRWPSQGLRSPCAHLSGEPWAHTQPAPR